MYYLLDPLTNEHPDRKDYVHSVESVERYKWMIDIHRLKELMAGSTVETAYYCGMSSNMFELFEMFDQVYYLPAEAEVIQQRLQSRTSEQFANTKEVQHWVVQRIPELEAKIRAQGGLPLPKELRLTN